MNDCSWKDKNSNTFYVIKVKPNAKKSKIEGLTPLPDNSELPVKKALLVSIAEQAEDNKANKELLELLSKELKIKKDKLSIKSGTSSRLKIVKLTTV